VYSYTREIKSRIAMAKAAYKKKKKVIVTGKFDLIVRKKLLKFCIWSVAL
jgi:hydroxyethylthiazole kinase-like sugar kinase family protein